MTNFITFELNHLQNKDIVFYSLPSNSIWNLPWNSKRSIFDFEKYDSEIKYKDTKLGNKIETSNQETKNEIDEF